MPNDTVNHPPHYGGEDDPYEVIKVIEAWDLDFHSGNAIKYIARWYIDRLIYLYESDK